MLQRVTNPREQNDILHEARNTCAVCGVGHGGKVHWAITHNVPGGKPGWWVPQKGGPTHPPFGFYQREDTPLVRAWQVMELTDAAPGVAGVAGAVVAVCDECADCRQPRAELKARQRAARMRLQKAAWANSPA